MAGTRRRLGHGLYRRGRILWLKVRTPAALANLLPPFWRSSLRTTSDREALAAARIVRAALDMGFRAIEAGMQSGTMSREQAEAVIAAVGRRALASAEALRALAGPRPEAAIVAARRAHAAEAQAWRGVLRRNELAAVLPLLAAAAAESGLYELTERPGPDLLREAARMLAVVAEENARREDGLYAGDRDQMLSRLASHEAPSRGAPIEPNASGAVASSPLIKEGPPPGRFVVIDGGGAAPRAPAVAADQGLAQMFACPVPAAEDLARWRASTELQVAADPDERVGSSGTAAIEAPRPLALSVSEGSSRLPPPRPSLDQAEQLRPEPVGGVPATTGSSALAAAPP
jgi:hypothetical protein